MKRAKYVLYGTAFGFVALVICPFAILGHALQYVAQRAWDRFAEPLAGKLGELSKPQEREPGQ